MLIDSDDYIDPEMAEKLYEALSAAKADMSICGYRIVSEAGEIISSHTTEGQYTPRQVMQEEVFRFAANYSNYWNSAWNKLYKRELFQSLRYPEGKTYEDDFISTELYLKCERIVFVPDVLYNYLRRDDSITGRPWTLSRFDLAESRFKRAIFYAGCPGYEQTALKTLLLGTEQMYSKALFTLIRNVRDPRHRKRYRDLNKLLRGAYKTVRKSGAKPTFGERVWLGTCSLS